MEEDNNRLLEVGEYKRRQAALEGNEIVKRPLARLDDDIIPRKTKAAQGRKKKYTPTKLRNAINNYFEWVEQTDEVPSIKGLIIHLKLYKDAFYRYANEYPEFKDIIEHARMIISEWAERDVYNTKGMAAGKIQYMKNVHGWSDKLETNNTTTQVTITPEMARAKLEMLAPRLLELLGSQTVVNQIAHKSAIEGEVIDA